MALKIVDGKETRVPGSAMPEGKRREGMLGKLDRMGLREFQKLPLLERESLLTMARKEKAESEAKILLVECDAHQRKVEGHNRLGIRHVENNTITGWAHSLSQYDDPDSYCFPYISAPTFNVQAGDFWEKSDRLIDNLKKLKIGKDGALTAETVKRMDAMAERMDSDRPIALREKN
ncbi:MAG: hypothetical protein WC861_02150 [Candidatus Micrarchaeia archaeon]|jgi:hypothetical protein